MTIVYYDGSTLTCDEIEIAADGKNLIADGVRLVPLLEIVRIV